MKARDGVHGDGHSDENDEDDDEDEDEEDRFVVHHIVVEVNLKVWNPQLSQNINIIGNKENAKGLVERRNADLFMTKQLPRGAPTCNQKPAISIHMDYIVDHRTKAQLKSLLQLPRRYPHRLAAGHSQPISGPSCSSPIRQSREPSVG